MGCGASVEPQHADHSSNELIGNNNTKTLSNQNGSVKKNETEYKDQRQHVAIKKSKILTSDLPPPRMVPKAVAFDIQLDNNIDSILSKSPPKRLKRLEPLENTPKLSAEMLEEKLRLAEEKRQRQLEKKKAASKKSASKKRLALQRAQEMEKSVQMQQAGELEEKLKSADKNREAKQQELEEKKRIRERRAKQAREKARQMKQEENGLEFDVEKDDHFNASDDDSWIEGTDNHQGDRIYSGRESPHKQAGRPQHEFRGFSASTTDSHDFAFQRQPTASAFDPEVKTDDFFDT